VKPPAYASEAALCSAFIAWVARTAPDVTCYAEWAGWDILLVYPEGFQIGIQAKLRLNAKVVEQSSPSFYDDADQGPDYRGVLVPARNGLSEIVHRLGLVEFWPYMNDYRSGLPQFAPELREPYGKGRIDANWLDWNPKTRHPLPPTLTDAVAGSSAPVSLTTWKLRALAVLAELDLRGVITTKRVRQIGCDPRRWLQQHWLLPGEKRGDWIRGEKCPSFDLQHPQAYAHVLDQARGLTTEATS
jgi:hypothetical protein